MSASTRKNAWPEVKYSQTQLGGVAQQGQFMPGGLDLITPSLRLLPGVLRDTLNFECAQQGGYARIEGYERFDGRQSPSSATFSIIQIRQVTSDFNTDFNSDFGRFQGDNFVETDFDDDFEVNMFNSGFVYLPSVGDIVTQGVTGATGRVVAVVEVPVPYIVITQVTGVFNETDPLYVAGPIFIGYPTPVTISLTLRQIAIYTALAADAMRQLVGQVPGSGPVLGVLGMVFNGVDEVFAWRANAGNTAVLVWKSTPTGWTSVPLGSLVAFTGGTGAGPPLDGEVLTQGGVSATISRVMWQDGAWTATAGTAKGEFVIGNSTGGDFAAGTATTSISGVTVTVTGPETPIGFMPGGRFEFTKGNFSGQEATRRAYGCDGVNRAFEFDGTTIAPIKTGLVPDAPKHITFHKNYLFIAFGSSILHCGASLPFRWSAVDGAGEIATGDAVNGMVPMPGDQTSATLAVILRGGMAVLYGTDPTTWNYVAFSTVGGGYKYSIQNMFDMFVLDDFGVVSLKTTLNFGNFAPSSLTKSILPFIARQRGSLTASSVNREKGQYRLFFRDGYGVYLSMMNQNYLGATTVRYPHPIYCTDTMHRTTGEEASFAGGFSGYVYHLDIGTSFDGEEINAYFTTTWDYLKSPRILKRWRAISMEMQGESYTEFSFGYQLGYENAEIAQIPAIMTEANLSGIARWDDFTWDNFVWDGSRILPTDLDMTGTAENVRVQIASATTWIPSYTVNSFLYHYSMRRGMRV